MGNYFTSNVKKNQQAMMERQLQLQYQMQKRQMAMQIGKSRDTFMWFSVFYATAATGLLAGFRKTKRPALLMPLVPLTFVTAYFWDLAYGNKIHRIRIEAEHVMANEGAILELPCGLPSISAIDLSRLEEETNK